MQRKQLAPEVFISNIPAEKFKTSRITIHFILPSRRENATCAALLPLMLERSCAAWPDLTGFSKKLGSLYGAALSAEGVVQGSRRDIGISISGIKDRFALNGESLSDEYARVLFEVAFAPYFVNGVFDEESLEVEKQKLREMLENEVNEKRLYCVRQARRRFFGDSPAGVEKNGYLDEVDAITPEELTDFYHEMIRTARIEVMVIGADGEKVAGQLTEQLARLCREPVSLPDFYAMPPLPEPVREVEAMDTVQGKLCMLFTTGRLLTEEEYAAMRVAGAIFGSMPTSRLFLNVREKQSLCYYCSAGFSMVSGMMMVDSGVEHANAEKAEKAILAELTAMQNELAEEEELNVAKRNFYSALNAVDDSLYSIENWYFGGILRGHIADPEDVAKSIAPVNARQVRDILRMLRLSVVYKLTKEESAHE